MTLVIDKKPFEPTSDRITMYACGPTVYSTPHIGNLRSAIVADTLFRVLRSQATDDQRVVFIRNYTDIDDKIIDRIVQEGLTLEDITETAIAEYEADLLRLNALPPTYKPRVTEHLADIISFIEKLIESGHAYEMNGHVLFDRVAYPEFFLNPQIDPDQLQNEESDYKRGPHDFVLWKPITAEKPVGWPSPWGEGRPGWHIECSAMIESLVGTTLDFHLGGNDLRFPHHECECAQSHALMGKPLANHWLHNGMLMFDDSIKRRGGTMSKSKGNIVTLNDLLLKGTTAQAVRYFFLSGHYRQPLSYTKEALATASSAVASLNRAFRMVGPVQRRDYVGPLLNDLHTPMALAELHAMAKRIRGHLATDDEIADFLSLADALGLHYDFEEKATDEVLAIREQRREARERKDYAESDRLRGVLIAMGVEVSDAPV